MSWRLSWVRFVPMRSVHLATFTIVAVLISAVGCGTSTGIGHDAGPDAGGRGTGGAPDPCAQCASLPASGWGNYPVLAWIGAEKDAPQCPADVPAFAYEGHADLSAPLNCGSCTCTPPMGTCLLSTTMTANATTCGLGGTTTQFDPSAGWTGACDANDSIPAGKLCGGVDCVQSLTIGPLTVNDTVACTASQPPAQSAPTWQTFVRACQGVPQTACEGGAGFCFPASPPGFRVCILRQGDNDCSLPQIAPYTEKHVFYDTFEDTRACSACTCGAPTGSTCSSTVSIYTDGACSTLAYSATVDAAGPACQNVTAGTPLGSKSASLPKYTAGACTPSGGMAAGAATPLMPTTLCCIPL